MKKIIIIVLLACLTISFNSCSTSPTNKAQSSVKSYLKANLKNSGSYEPISFSVLDTIKNTNFAVKKKTPNFIITHFYSVTSSENEKVKMTITFYLDKDFKIMEPTPTSLNGDYGSLTGSAYWKYNDYVGNKADVGAKVVLYSLDTIRGQLKYETAADVQGNFKFEKILTGKYFLMVQSKNATDCPESHLMNFEMYSTPIKQLFGFDIQKYKTRLGDINILDSIYRKTIMEFPSNGTYAQMAANSSKVEVLGADIREKSDKLIDTFPDKFKSDIELFTGYGKAFEFTNIKIEENKSVNQNADFGITCI